ncbi:hypothetical protein KP729_005191|uniref:hypothetical protein n=1 Tax=Delftia acidovorans TaxID=80866 RepID=UPI001C0D9FDB|nr:hypothetical protein [Delftia acidovorans]MCA1071780.1 hypothetical protein [Delftia acidovorans]
MSSLDPIISADLVRARAELAALSTALASARGDITWIANNLGATRSELAAARNEIAAGTASSPIKSVQRGIATMTPSSGGFRTLTVNVAAVNTAKSILNVTGMQGVRYENTTPIPGYAQITSSTTIMFSVGYDLISGYFSPTYWGWELVEYK